MSSENIKQQLINGYTKAEKGLNGERIKDWVSSESVYENRGAVAAIAFYGATIRECMARGIDDPMQAHSVALAVLELLKDADFENIVQYLVGGPLPIKKIEEIIEHYKKNYQADVTAAFNMIDNIKIKIGFNDDDDFEEILDFDFEEEDDDD